MAIRKLKFSVIPYRSLKRLLALIVRKNSVQGRFQLTSNFDGEIIGEFEHEMKMECTPWHSTSGRVTRTISVGSHLQGIPISNPSQYLTATPPLT